MKSCTKKVFNICIFCLLQDAVKYSKVVSSNQGGTKHYGISIFCLLFRRCFVRKLNRLYLFPRVRLFRKWRQKKQMILRKDIEAILQRPEEVQKLAKLYNNRYCDEAANVQYKAAIKAFQVQIENVKLNKNLL